MPRILIHLATPGGMSGAPRRTLHLCEALRGRGIEVGVVGDPADEFFKQAVHRGFEVLPLPRPEFLSRKHKVLLRGWPWTQIRAVAALLRMTVRLVAIIRAWQADVLWTRGAKGIAFVAAAVLITRRPLIWDVAMEHSASRLVRVLHRIGLALSAAVVLQYAAAARRIFGAEAAAKYARKVHPLLPAIEAEPLRRFRSSSGRTGSRKPVVLLLVGSVTERKNQGLAIECLAHLRAAGADAELWIAGDLYDPAYGERVTALATQLGVADHVKFLGWRGDVYELMAQSDVFLLPSHDEGVSNAIQEAMFLGLPVVVSDAGGSPEIVENGVTGWSLPLDREAWLRVLGPLVESAELRRRIGAAAARYAAEAFDERTWPDQYAALIRGIAKGNR